MERDSKKPDLSGFILDTTGPDKDESSIDEDPISSSDDNKDKSNEEDFDWDDAFLDEELSDTLAFNDAGEMTNIPEKEVIIESKPKTKTVKLKL